MSCHRRRERLLQGKPPSDLRKSGETGNTLHPQHVDVHNHVLSFGRSYSHYSMNSSDAFITGYHCVSELWKNWLMEEEEEVFYAFKKNNTYLTYETSMREMPISLQSLFKPQADQNAVGGFAQPKLLLLVTYQY